MVFGLIISGISSLVSTVVSTLAPVLAKIAPILEAITPLLKGIISISKLFADNSIEEMGEKVLSAEDHLDDFDSFEDYRKYIMDRKVDLSESKFTPQERQLAGLSFGLRCIEDDLDINVEEGTLTLLNSNPDYFTKERTWSYFKAFSQAGLELEQLSQYFDDVLPTQVENEIEGVLLTCERELNPQENDITHLEYIKRQRN
jgi:hypothetical protein